MHDYFFYVTLYSTKINIMNREIKFRGQRTDNKEFIYGNYSDMSDIVSTWLFIEFANNGQRERHIVIPETVGQFTGLKDKKCVNIYDGDKILYDGIIGTVYFDNCSYYVNFEYTRSIHLLGELERDLEVIGNIHSNPELLTLNK